MATSGTHRTTSTRTVRKIEPPRPLKDSSLNELNAKSSYSPLALSSYTIDCVEKLIALMDMVVNGINQFGDVNANMDSSILTSNILHLCKYLKIYGPQLENSIYQGQLDRAFLSFREGMVQGILEYEARLHLLDLVELRECNWIPRKDLLPVTNTNVISKSPSSQDFSEYSDIANANDSLMGFYSEDLNKRPVKLREKSSKTGSKSYLRNEVIIKNSDSGKVMGIKGRRVHMIEQLSETIISFQRVPPTAKERVVQITGPSEDRISYATRLIESTIRNNASPVKELCESESSCSSEESFYGNPGCDEFGNIYSNTQTPKLVDQPYLYKHKVVVRNCHLTITGDDYTYVTVAKAILDDYFSKLRMSESFENINYNDDVILDESLLKDENLRKFVSYNLNKVSESGDCESYRRDFSGVSNIIAGNEDDFSYIAYNSQNKTYDHQIDSILSSDINSLSLTPNYEDSTNSVPLPTEANESLKVKSDTSRTSYSKEFLLRCRDLESSKKKPKDWELITLKFPQLLKESENSSDATIIIE